MKDQFQYVDIREGGAAGIEHDELAIISGGDVRTEVTCIDYSPENVSIQEGPKPCRVRDTTSSGMVRRALDPCGGSVRHECHRWIIR